MDRVLALQRKAESTPYEEEAKLFEAKAAALIKKHNLDPPATASATNSSRPASPSSQALTSSIAGCVSRGLSPQDCLASLANPPLGGLPAVLASGRALMKNGVVGKLPAGW